MLFFLLDKCNIDSLILHRIYKNNKICLAFICTFVAVKEIRNQQVGKNGGIKQTVFIKE